MKTIVAMILGLTLAACDNSGQAPPTNDLAVPADLAGGGGDMAQVMNPDLGCYGNPMTHVEIINACTNADSFDKTPFYPMLAPNGVLPMLP